MDFPQTSESLFFTLGELINLADAYPYLVNGERRLRNRLGFHAAIMLLCEAAMERLVLPYNDGASLDAVGLLSLRNWDFGGEPSPGEYFFLENFLGNNLDDDFRVAMLRDFYASVDELGGIRFAPKGYFRALIRSTDSAARQRVSIFVGQLISSRHEMMWEVFPPCVHPLAGEVSGGFDDLATTGYVHNQAELEAAFSNRRVVELQEMETSQPCLTMEMLVGLMSQAYEGHRYATYFKWNSAYQNAFLQHDALQMTARPNLDLMALMQIMLACHWANWAKIEAVWSHLHLTESVTREYRIMGDGSVILINEYSTSDNERLDKLEWSRSVSSSSNGGQAVGERSPYTLDMRFSATELARTCPGFLLTPDEVRQCGGGQEVSLTPEALLTVEKHFNGAVPTGYNDDGTIDFAYFDNIYVRASVMSSRRIPIPGEEDRSRLERTDYPAATLIDDGRVKSVALASALAIDDQFKGYEADADSYKATRTPDRDGIKVKLIVKKSASQVTAQSVNELVGETVSESYAAHSLIDNNPCDLLETFTPEGVAAHGDDLGANVPTVFFAYYGSALSPVIDGKYAPYAIMFPSDYHTDTIDYRGGYYAWSRVGYCQAFAQDATVKRCSEHLIARHSSDAAVRAEWAWKAMPVTWN